MLLYPCIKEYGNIAGVGEVREHFGPVKREAGVSPARTRRCKRGAVFPQALFSCEGHWGIIPGKTKNSADP